MKRHLTQFGDQIGKLFIFPEYESEEDWNLSNSTVIRPFSNQTSGSYFPFGCGQEKVTQTTYTKRFVLFSEVLDSGDEFTHCLRGGCEVCNELFHNPLTALIDYMNRGLQGGLKNLYAQMEDGTYRYKTAKVTGLNYSHSSDSSEKWRDFTVSFISPDPYWYEVDDSQTVLVRDIPFSTLVHNCARIKNYGRYERVSSCIPNKSACYYRGPILKLPYLADTGWNIDCPQPQENTDTQVEYCTKGSAGADSLCVKFTNQWTNPTISDENDNTFTYNGNIATGQYLKVCMPPYTCDPSDLEYETNIPSFDTDDFELSNDTLYLNSGFNNITTSGNVSGTWNLTFRNRWW